MPSRSELLSQVFLKDRDLVSSLLEKSSICKDDTVLEAGPGTGIITDELLKKSGRVVAVEKDLELYRELQEKYQGNPSIKLYHRDVLKFALPNRPYKVFSNIPFAIEGQFVRKLIDDPRNPPQDSYLIMRREVAERMAGVPKDGQFSVLHKPWFDLEIFHKFRRNDFTPKPRVESSMMRFQRKEQPLVEREDKRLYELFVKQGYGGGRRLKQNLAPAFSSKQLNQLAQDHRFRVSDMPSQLAFEQWLGMFEFLNERVPEEQRRKFIARVRS